MPDMTYEPQPVDLLPLNNRMRNIMVRYPELVEQLLPIKVALEWLESANFQLRRKSGRKMFDQAGRLSQRQIEGLYVDTPADDDITGMALNADMVKAMVALDLRNLAIHLQGLITRDLLLSQGVPHKNVAVKTTQLAKKTGSKGGRASATKRQPLYDEIDRLFKLEKSRRPNERLTYYAHAITENFTTFINENKRECKMIGSPSGRNGERDYYDFIYRQLRQNHPSKHKK